LFEPAKDKSDLNIQVKKNEEKSFELLNSKNDNNDKNNKINNNVNLIVSKNNVRNLNISQINSDFYKFKNLSEAKNTKISSLSARSNSACMISSSAIEHYSKVNANNNDQNNNLRNKNLSNENNIPISQEILNESSNKYGKFTSNVNNDYKNENAALDNFYLDTIKRNQIKNSPINDHSKIFQYENLSKNTPTNISNYSNNSNINTEFKNINKFLNVSNNNLSKRILVTDIKQNTENNNNYSIDENSNYILKTHSDIKTNKKKMDFEIINNCMKSFLDLEKKVKDKLCDDKFISKTPINNKFNIMNKDFYELKENKTKELQLLSNINTNEGSKTSKNSNYANIKHNNLGIDSNIKEKKSNGNFPNENETNKKPNIPIASLEKCSKKFQLADLKFNINYEFDLYSQQEYNLNHQKRKESENSGNSKSTARICYSDNDYFEKAERQNFEPKINTPNSNIIEDKTGITYENKALSLQESKYF